MNQSIQLATRALASLESLVTKLLENEARDRNDLIGPEPLYLQEIGWRHDYNRIPTTASERSSFRHLIRFHETKWKVFVDNPTLANSRQLLDSCIKCHRAMSNLRWRLLTQGELP